MHKGIAYASAYTSLCAVGLLGGAGCSSGLPDIPQDGGGQMSDLASGDSSARLDATTPVGSSGDGGAGSGSSGTGSGSGSGSGAAGSSGASSGGNSSGSSSGGSSSGSGAAGDAAIESDAATASGDAAIGSDSGAPSGSPAVGSGAPAHSGCSCRVAGNGGSPAGLLLAACAVAGLGARRRRRR